MGWTQCFSCGVYGLDFLGQVHDSDHFLEGHREGTSQKTFFFGQLNISLCSVTGKEKDDSFEKFRRMKYFSHPQNHLVVVSHQSIQGQIFPYAT